jgi:hypothetical protein
MSRQTKPNLLKKIPFNNRVTADIATREKMLRSVKMLRNVKFGSKTAKRVPPLVSPITLQGLSRCCPSIPNISPPCC